MDKTKRLGAQISAAIYAASVLTLTVSDPSTASEVEDAIDELEQDFAAEHTECIPEPDDVSDLLQAIDSSTSEVDLIRGMRWLAASPFWDASDRKGDYWNIFLRLSEADNSFALRYYTGLAMIMQKDELISALIAEDRARIDQYLEWNRETNSIYADLARLAAAQFVLWDYSAVLISEPSEVANAVSGIQASLQETFASDDAQNFLAPTAVSQDISLTGAIFSKLSGGDASGTWMQIYDQHAADEQTAFDPALGVSQPDSRFLNPGRIVADIAFGPQSRLCAETERKLRQANNKFFTLARENRGRILNPIYAVEHACRGVLSNQSIGKLTDSMANVKNRDYRVVVGHTRGGAVRFSDLNPKELESKVRQHMEHYKEPERDSPQDTTTTCLAGASPSFFERNFDVGRFKSSESDDGYIYVGQGLTRAEAIQLAEFIRSERDFRGAYVFRPVDRR